MEVPHTVRKAYDLMYPSKRMLRYNNSTSTYPITGRKPWRARKGIFKPPRQRPRASKYITAELNSISFLKNTLATYDITNDITLGTDTGDRLTNRIFIHGVKVKLWYSNKNIDPGQNLLFRLACLDYADVNASNGTGIFEASGASNAPVNFGPGKILAPFSKSTVGCYHDRSHKIDILQSDSKFIEVYIPIKQYVNYSGSNPQRSIRIHWWFAYLIDGENSGDYLANFTTYFKDVV